VEFMYSYGFHLCGSFPIFLSELHVWGLRRGAGRALGREGKFPAARPAEGRRNPPQPTPRSRLRASPG
jgi:hypothetical protein